MNTDWADEQLEQFLRLTELYRPPDPPGIVNFTSRLSTRGQHADIVASAHVVEQILDRVLPRWREDVPSERNETVNRWYQHREAAQRARVSLARDNEVRHCRGAAVPTWATTLRGSRPRTCTAGRGTAPAPCGRAGTTATLWAQPQGS